jgi:hypothetical protein
LSQARSWQRSGRIDALKEEWVSGPDEPTRKRVQIEPTQVTKTIASAPKAARTVLLVRFDDGTTLYEDTAAQTFGKAVKKLGLSKVIELGMRVNIFPLVSKERSDTYAQTAVDSYWVMTHSSTEAKRDQLMKIAEALKEKIQVDIVSA